MTMAQRVGWLFGFDENLLKTENEEIRKKSKEIITLLISLINIAVEKNQKIYVEYVQF